MMNIIQLANSAIECEGQAADSGSATEHLEGNATSGINPDHLDTSRDIPTNGLSVISSAEQSSLQQSSPSAVAHHTVEPTTSSDARPQPPTRAYNMMSRQTTDPSVNRSMSDLIDGHALEVGLGGRQRTYPSAMQHFREGRYRDAAEVFVSHHRVYVSVATFLIMFGMTVAGLWLEIASQHQTVV